ncbi:DUF2752 domain-containing protein [Parapedobacter sp. 10938]|uniref:DUF2752 domain-containing protein n=1 Tax=Parapedobacter flavus TaxID=3110225 RepID=UPI002DB666B5|nr:DUF2752 domain-containing protein [Parapedobacter sp. 10938]MEC3881867.1 DUF2752 domain-containing protein [Parapedobacter sp. 10938]
MANTTRWLWAVCSLERSSWVQDWLLPCPIKIVTGFDCPGCGFQRSLLALLQGHWHESYRLYPPTVPLLVLLLYAVLKNTFGFDRRNILLKVLAVVCGWFVLVVYGMKLGYGPDL